MISLIKKMFSKENPFEFLPLIKNKIKVSYKFCELNLVNGSRIPSYRQDYIYSNIISELEYSTNDPEMIVYRIYSSNKDSFIQLQYKKGVLVDALYAKKEISLGYFTPELKKDLSNKEIIITDQLTSQEEYYIRDINPDEDVCAPVYLKENFKLQNTSEESLFTVFYKKEHDDLDNLEDSLVYFEIKNEILEKYKLFYVDVNKISIN